jgi:hypothetical protein
MEQWRFALASVVGTSHAKATTPCQDSAECRVLDTAHCGPVLVIVASDGAGSASRAEIGSRLVCGLLMDELISLYERNGRSSDINNTLVENWLKKLQDEVLARANEERLSVREYACTLLAAVIEPNQEAFLQIGDGAIVLSSRGEKDEYNWVFWPERGEYANQTHFVTDENAKEHLQLDVSSTGIDEIALFTDGIQSLALHYASQTAYAPFFQSLFVPIRDEFPGISERLSIALANLLDSPKVNTRTDDDKTIVIATRCNKVIPLVVMPESEPGCE